MSIYSEVTQSRTPLAGVPAYDDLPVIDSTGEHHSWHAWGAGDELGTMNRLDRDATLRGIGTVETGEVLSLSLPLDEPGPGIFLGREAYERTEVRTHIGREDSITNLDLQFSTQWDGLRHIRHKFAGYYGGRDESDLDRGALGIENLAKRGIVGRGVLVDAPAYFAAKGVAYAANERIPFGPGLVEEILQYQQVELALGDILVVRTGWVDWYRSLGADQREALRGTVKTGEGALGCPGLRGDEDMSRWLWNSGLAAVAADNPTVEALPVDRNDGFLHRRALPLLGMSFGELWSLKELSERCHRLGRYTFLLTSAPLNIPAGVASPANVLAVL